MDVVECTRQLVRAQSVTPDTGAAIDIMGRWLKDLGFDVHELIFDDADFPTVKNIYARYGKTGKNICFAGHTDVVPAGDDAQWTYPPYSAEVVDEHIHGRGTADMKGSLAAFYCAAREFISAHADDDYSVSFLLTGDEEGPAINGTAKVLAWMKERGEKIDYCLVGEPTASKNVGDTIKVGRRGSMQCFVEVQGVQGHAAYPEKAVNPLPILVECLHAFENIELDTGNEFFQPSNLEILDLEVGNDRDNVIPAVAKGRLNVRFNSEHRSSDIKAILEKCAASISDRIHLSYRVSGESFLTEDETIRNAISDAIAAVTDIETDASTSGGTSDARFIHSHCPVIECGVQNATIHKVNEKVSVDALQTIQKIYEGFLGNLLSR